MGALFYVNFKLGPLYLLRRNPWLAGGQIQFLIELENSGPYRIRTSFIIQILLKTKFCHLT